MKKKSHDGHERFRISLAHPDRLHYGWEELWIEPDNQAEMSYGSRMNYAFNQLRSLQKTPLTAGKLLQLTTSRIPVNGS